VVIVDPTGGFARIRFEDKDDTMTSEVDMTVPGIQRWLDECPFIAFLGLICDEIDVTAGTLSMRMPMRAELERGAGTGQFHGGPIASLIDTAGDFAVILVSGASVPTINFRVDYLRPSFGGFLTARASVRRTGRSIGVSDVDVFDDQKRLVAVGRGCYAMAPG